jgi:hypothetical protein
VLAYLTGSNEISKKGKTASESKSTVATLIRSVFYELLADDANKTAKLELNLTPNVTSEEPTATVTVNEDYKWE